MSNTRVAEDRVYLTLNELAELLRISTRTAYQLAAAGGVPAVKVGGQWRIPRAALDRQLNGGHGEAKP